jgi:hypothetical protein
MNVATNANTIFHLLTIFMSVPPVAHPLPLLVLGRNRVVRGWPIPAAELVVPLPGLGGPAVDPVAWQPPSVDVDGRKEQGGQEAPEPAGPEMRDRDTANPMTSAILSKRRHFGVPSSKCPKRMFPRANRLATTAISNQ